MSRTSPCAHGHALIPVASTPTSRRTPLSERGGDPDQRDHLLRRELGHGRQPLERILRADPHLGAQRALPLDDVLRDVLGERLDHERLADHDALDRLLEQLREARHVDALLRRGEVDGAVDLRRDDLLEAAPAEVDRLRDARDAGAREAELHLGLGGLEVVV